MSPDSKQLRPSGKGFVLAEVGGGFPPMRRLVTTFTATDKIIYIQLDGEIVPLLPEHVFLSGN